MCSRCGEAKPIEQFPRWHAGKEGRNSACAACHATYARVRRMREPIREWARIACNNARSRARRAGLAFSLTVPLILARVIPVCPVFQTPLIYTGERTGNEASIDRVVPELGYVPTNIEIISMKANRIKNNGSPQDLEAVASWLRGVLHVRQLR